MSETRVAQRRRVSRAALMTLAVMPAVLTCRRPQDVVSIGVGYRAQGHVADLARLVADSLAGPGAIRIVTETGARAGWDAAGEVDHATRLAGVPGIAGVVGHGGSREALTTAPIYSESHIPQIVPTATSRRLISAGPWTFTLAPNDSIEGLFLGEFVATHLRARTATVFYVLDEYGAGLRDGAVAALHARGVRVLDEVPVQIEGDCAPFAPANTFGTAVDAALLQGHPDVIILATRQREAGCIVARLTELTLHLPIVGGDGLLANRAFSDRAGRGADSVYVVTFWHPARADSLSRAFVQHYQRKFGIDPRHDEAMVYDALLAFIAAVREVGPGHEQVRDYLASLGRGRPALPGVTGPITFPGGRERLMMTRFVAGRLEIVRPS